MNQINACAVAIERCITEAGIDRSDVTEGQPISDIAAMCYLLMGGE